MKKSFWGIFLALALTLACGSWAAAEDKASEDTGKLAEDNAETVIAKTASPVEQFTGKYWVDTSETGKEAYLFGLESAIEIEYYVSKELAKKNMKRSKKGATYTLSPFEKGWMEALDGVPRKDIAAMVDSWYAAHPDQLNRPVLGVLWNEVIVPRLKTVK